MEWFINRFRFHHKLSWIASGLPQTLCCGLVAVFSRSSLHFNQLFSVCYIFNCFFTLTATFVEATCTERWTFLFHYQTQSCRMSTPVELLLLSHCSLLVVFSLQKILKAVTSVYVESVQPGRQQLLYSERHKYNSAILFSARSHAGIWSSLSLIDYFQV